MKKVLVVLVFVAVTFFIYTAVFGKEETPETRTYTLDIEDIDRTEWFVGQWGGFKSAYDLISKKSDAIVLSSFGNLSPYLISKPIEIKDGDVITLTRKVKLSHGESVFAGGLAMYQTDDAELVPSETDGSWMTSLGDGVFLVEYSYDLSENQTRPGKDVIRFLAADWEYNDNYQLINPIYDEWVTESLVYDTRSNQITYTLNDTSYRLNSYKLDRGNVRFLIHAYGEGTDASLALESLTITVENKRNPRLQ